jgi:hypothetical protein
VGVQSDRIRQELEQAFLALKTEFARRLLAKLRAATPVDTGYARSRWVAVELGAHIDVLNDAPYIMVLNDGHSKQAAAGFIERCIDETIAEMRLVIQRPIRILLTQGELFEYHPAEGGGV